MSCAPHLKNLSALVMGDLEGDERDALVAHLKDCAACRAERAHLDGVLSAVKRLPAPEPSGARRERVVAAMSAAAEGTSEVPATLPRRPMWRFGVAAAALLAILGTWGVATGRIGLAPATYELQVDEIVGEALFKHAEGSTWEPLTPGQKIKMGDRVLTNGGRVWLRSNSSDRFVLADGTQFMINRNEKKNPSLMLVYGDVWAEVSPRTDGRLRIESPEGEGFAEVIGTRFHVEYR